MKVLKLSLVLVISLFFPVAVVSAKSGINPAVVLIQAPKKDGMGWVIGRNLVITAAHVVENGRGVEWRGERIIIYFQPFISQTRLGRLVSLDQARDLALIRVDTGDTRPYQLATNVNIGEAVYWNVPGERFPIELQRVFGKILKKEVEFRSPGGLTRQEYHVYESTVPPVGSELVLQVDRVSTPGSSGGVVTDDRGQAIGLLVFAYYLDKTTGMISADGIRRFMVDRFQKRPRFTTIRH